jgi:hypothetical protein
MLHAHIDLSSFHDEFGGHATADWGLDAMLSSGSAFLFTRYTYPEVWGVLEGGGGAMSVVLGFVGATGIGVFSGAVLGPA